MKKSNEIARRYSIEKFMFDFFSVVTLISAYIIGILSKDVILPGKAILGISFLVLLVIIIVCFRTNGFSFNSKYSLQLKVGSYLLMLLVVSFIFNFFFNLRIFIEFIYQNGVNGKLTITERKVMNFPFLHVLFSTFFFIVLQILFLKSKSFGYGYKEAFRIIIFYFLLLNTYLLVDNFLKLHLLIIPYVSSPNAFSFYWLVISILVLPVPIILFYITYSIYIIIDYNSIKTNKGL